MLRLLLKTIWDAAKETPRLFFHPFRHWRTIKSDSDDFVEESEDWPETPATSKVVPLVESFQASLDRSDEVK
jgi:hypothetical protein